MVSIEQIVKGRASIVYYDPPTSTHRAAHIYEFFGPVRIDWAEINDGPHPGWEPSHAYDLDAGIDLASNHDVDVYPDEIVSMATGVAFDPGPAHWLLIIGRSSALAKWGLQIHQAVIDPGYRGEMIVKVSVADPGQWIRATNYTDDYTDEAADKPVRIPAGTKLAQVIPIRRPDIYLEKKLVLDESERGDQGFGSSG